MRPARSTRCSARGLTALVQALGLALALTLGVLLPTPVAADIVSVYVGTAVMAGPGAFVDFVVTIPAGATHIAGWGGYMLGSGSLGPGDFWIVSWRHRHTPCPDACEYDNDDHFLFGTTGYRFFIDLPTIFLPGDGHAIGSAVEQVIIRVRCHKAVRDGTSCGGYRLVYFRVP